MPTCLIGVGSNLGRRHQILDAVLAQLQRHENVTANSRWFSFPAVGGPSNQNGFLNGALVVDTEKTPYQLTELLHKLEKDAGRVRTEQRWASRTLDCDLLLFGSEQISSDSLTVPHPRMMTRRFVLEPSVQVAPEMVHPHIGWTIKELFDHLSAPPYFTVISPDEVFFLKLTRALARESNGKVVSIGQEFKTQMPSLANDTPLESGEQARQLPERAIIESQFSIQPVINTFYHRFGNVEIVNDPLQHPLRPKLLIVTEPIDSAFSRSLEKHSQSQVPTVHLSSNRKHGLQDAVGAVLAMK